MVASGSVIYYNGVVKKIAPLGPAPTPLPDDPPVEATDPSRRRLLQVIARRPGVGAPDGRRPRRGGRGAPQHHAPPPARARRRRAWSVEEHRPPAGGRGRPATRYAVTAGRSGGRRPRRVGGSAAQEYVALAAAFAERLAERDGDPGADSRAIGRSWGTGLAARHAADEGGVDERPVGRVVGLLDRLGFSPEVEPTTHGTTRRAGPRGAAAHLPPARRRPAPPRGRLPGAPRPRRRGPRGRGDQLRRGAGAAALRAAGSLRARAAPHTGAMSTEHPAPDERRHGRRARRAAPRGGSAPTSWAPACTGRRCSTTVVGSLPASWPVVVVGPAARVRPPGHLDP